MKLLPLAALAAVALVVAGPADAKKKKKTYCQKVIKQQHGKVKNKSGGVTFSISNRKEIDVCSDKYKKSAGLIIMDDGQKFLSGKAVKGRCVAMSIKGSSKAYTEIAYADFVHDVGTSVQQLAYPAFGGTLVSYSVSRNCAVAWGQSTPDGARSIQLVSMSERDNSLTRGLHYTVATVDSEKDLKSVKAKAAGKKVKVSWKQGGVAKSALYPDAASATP